MIQEFRYATPGGLLVFLFGLGFYLVDTTIAPRAVIIAALGALAFGWVSYQWMAYLGYRQGGVERYHEIRALKTILEKTTNAKIAFKVQDHEVVIGGEELCAKARDLGKRYAAGLPCQSAARADEATYWAPVHDALFAGAKEHDYARGAYSVHHTLSIIYWVLLWGLNFIGLAIIATSHASLQRMCWLLLGLWAFHNIFITLAGGESKNFKLVPSHYRIMIFLVDAVPGIIAGFQLPVSLGAQYVICCIIFGSYMLWTSIVPWRMVLLEAELREEMMTWIFQQYVERQKAAVAG